jgi:TetR/AcrR family transcriptional repressor of mexJK operon
MSVLTSSGEGPPRRKRSYLPAGDRKAQILEHAKTTFIMKGFHRASVGDICARAGVSRATLYQYFDNKREVLLALLEGVLARVRKVLDERVPLEELAIEPRRLTAAAVQAFCERRMRELLDAIFVDEKTLRLVLRDARGLDQVVEKVIAEIDALLLGALEREIRAGQTLGILAAGDPRLLARHNLGGIEKVVLMALARDDEPFDLGAVVRDTVRVQLNGILAEEVRR